VSSLILTVCLLFAYELTLKVLVHVKVFAVEAFERKMASPTFRVGSDGDQPNVVSYELNEYDCVVELH